jgi:hypothetical protein
VYSRDNLSGVDRISFINQNRLIRPDTSPRYHSAWLRAGRCRLQLGGRLGSTCQEEAANYRRQQTCNKMIFAS